jgi:hypothetical protein
MGLHQVKNLCIAKERITGVKKRFIEWEKNLPAVHPKGD